MLRLLIVDDERNTREGLEECVDWAALGVTVAGKACNGLEGLKLAEQIKPELVLTDVCMPKMDGIELAKRLHEINPEICVVFVSGYSDLNYLKSAYKCDAVDYLLKPVDIEELEQVIRNVVGASQKRKSDIREREEMEKRLRESMPYLREKFLLRLVSEEWEADEIEKQLKFLGIDLSMDSYYNSLIIGIEDVPKAFDVCSQKEQQLLSFSVQNAVQEIIERYTQGFVVEWGVREYACVLQITGKEKDDCKLVKEVCDEVQRNLEQYMEIRCSIGVGRREEGLWGVAKSFRLARNALSRRMILGSNIVIYTNDCTVDMEEVFFLPEIFYERLTSAILNGDEEHAAGLLYEVFEILRRTERKDEVYFRNGCLLIASYIISAVGRLEIQDKRIIEKISKIHMQVLQFNTLEAILDLFLSTVTDICKDVAERRRSKKDNVVDEVKNIILKRYREKLSVEEIARSVYLSTAHICFLFKQETGQTINGYLTEVRLHKAKKLLLTGEHKVCAVAALVGYQDQKYFCKLFKKYTGVNPSEYR